MSNEKNIQACVMRLATFGLLIDSVAHTIAEGMDPYELLADMDEKHETAPPFEDPVEQHAFNSMYDAMRNVITFSMEQKKDD